MSVNIDKFSYLHGFILSTLFYGSTEDVRNGQVYDSIVLEVLAFKGSREVQFSLSDLEIVEKGGVRESLVTVDTRCSLCSLFSGIQVFEMTDKLLVLYRIEFFRVQSTALLLSIFFKHEWVSVSLFGWENNVRVHI